MTNLQRLERRQTIAQVVAGYDPCQSSTYLMTGSCHADYCPDTGRLVVVFLTEIEPDDWQQVLDNFGFHHEEFDYDFAIQPDGWHIIMLTEIRR